MKNRKLIYTTALLGITIFAGSCSKFLDRAPDNKITEEAVFNNWDKVNGAANRLYRDMRERDRGIVGLQDFSIAGITDEAKGTKVETGIPDLFNFGSFGPSIGMPPKANGMYWNDFYTSIRRTNCCPIRLPVRLAYDIDLPSGATRSTSFMKMILFRANEMFGRI